MRALPGPLPFRPCPLTSAPSPAALDRECQMAQLDPTPLIDYLTPRCSPPLHEFSVVYCVHIHSENDTLGSTL